jgi:hypothetical protein
MPMGESNKFVYDTSAETGKPLTTHQWYDGTPHPWEFKRVWHLEPSLDDPDTVYAGVEDAACFVRPTAVRRGRNFPDCAATAPDLSGNRAPAACACTRLFWIPRIANGSLLPSPPRVRFAVTTAARRGNRSIRDCTRNTFPIRRRGGPLRSSHCDASFEFKRAVHAETLGRDAQRRRGRLVARVSGNLPTDFGFVIDVHAHEPETIYVVPIKSDSEHYPPDGKLRVYRSRTGGNEWEALTNGLPQENCYVNVLRDAMAVDSLDSCGVYFGTTGGQVYASADAGDTWAPIVRDLPPVLSVEVQTLS